MEPSLKQHLLLHCMFLKNIRLVCFLYRHCGTKHGNLTMMPRLWESAKLLFAKKYYQHSTSPNHQTVIFTFLFLFKLTKPDTIYKLDTSFVIPLILGWHHTYCPKQVEQDVDTDCKHSLLWPHVLLKGIHWFYSLSLLHHLCFFFSLQYVPSHLSLFGVLNYNVKHNSSLCNGEDDPVPHWLAVYQ